MKEGTLFSSSNYWAWRGVWVPEVAWAVKLWKQHKLSHQAFLSLSLKFREGHAKRKADVEAIIAGEATESFEREQQEARAQIARSEKPFNPYPSELSAWMLQYAVAQERYKILVLYGPSCTGKSKLARHLYGEDMTLVVDVQGAKHPDLRSYIRARHKAILLDDCASPSFIVDNKKLLQAHVDGALLGQSATQLFSYFVFLWRVPIIVTTNNWDLTEMKEHDKEWLDTNCIAVKVQRRVWSSASSTPIATEERKRVWRSPHREAGAMDLG